MCSLTRNVEPQRNGLPPCHSTHLSRLGRVFISAFTAGASPFTISHVWARLQRAESPRRKIRTVVAEKRRKKDAGAGRRLAAGEP